MKIKIKREPFLRVLQIAAAVAPSRSPRPILQNVKIEVAGDRTQMTATDMEVGVRLTVPEVEVETPGCAVIPAQRLSMILRESSDEMISINAEKENAVIKGANNRFKLPTFAPDEFPEVAEFDSEGHYELSALLLQKIIQRTLFAADVKSSRFALGGVLLEIDGSSMNAVATDGRRLARMSGAIKKIGEPKETGPPVVPAKAMQLIGGIFKSTDPESRIQMAIRHNDLLLRSDDVVFYTRLVEGRFPKWRDIIPDRSDSHKIPMPVGPLYTCLRQASIVAGEESRGIDFTFKGGSLVMTNETAEIGQSRVEIPVPFDADDLTTTLDHRFVADFLKVLDNDQNITFDVKDSDSGVYCSTDDNYGYLMMPLIKDRK